MKNNHYLYFALACLTAFFAPRLLAAPRTPKPAPQVVTAPALTGDWLVPDLVSNVKMNATGKYYTLTLRRAVTPQTAQELASWQARKGKVVRFP